MFRGSTPKRRRLRVRLVSVALIAGLLLSSYPSVLPDGTDTQFHDEPLQSEADADTASQDQQLVFYHGTSEEEPVNILADVAIDEDFVNLANDGWLVELQDTLDGTNALLSTVGLRLKAESVQQWHSDGDLYFISSHLKLAEEQVQRVPGHLFLALTGQDTIRYDGFVWESGNRMIVRFYPKDREHTYTLIAHEIGHLLGAKHHEDEEECTEEGCIMDRVGFAHATIWCEHHQKIIQENVASRLAAQAS